uniref:Uncharacterized protein n=1 Tax=Zea mays TaxID=4577 RepID=A0A804PT45_MAIZE
MEFLVVKKEALEADLGSCGLDVGLHLLPELSVGEGPIPAGAAGDDGIVPREGEVAEREPLRRLAGRHPVPHAAVRVAADGPRHVAQVDEQRAGSRGRRDVAPRAAVEHLQAAGALLLVDDGEHGAVGVGLHAEAPGLGAPRVAVHPQEPVALREVGRRLGRAEAQRGGERVEERPRHPRHVRAVLRPREAEQVAERRRRHGRVLLLLLGLAQGDVEALDPVDVADAERERRRAPEVARLRALVAERRPGQRGPRQREEARGERRGHAVVREAEHAELPARRCQRLPRRLQVHRRQLQRAPAPGLLLLLVNVASALVVLLQERERRVRRVRRRPRVRPRRHLLGRRRLPPSASLLGSLLCSVLLGRSAPLLGYTDRGRGGAEAAVRLLV